MRRLLRHAATVTLPKVVTVLLLLAGLADRPVALLAAAYVTWRGVVTLRAGWREQYIEPFRQQMARHWRELVWDNTRWLNHLADRLETPHEGIDRLAGPWEGARWAGAAVGARSDSGGGSPGSVVAATGRRRTLGSTSKAAVRRAGKGAGRTRPPTDGRGVSGRAPHELAIR